MRRLALLLGVLLGLSACAEVATVPAPAGPVAVAAAPAPPLPREAREMARAFIQVVEDVEPVAEALCRQSSPRRNCDFLVVVDDRLDQPPNAFQTEDETGRPVIAFTLSLIAEARNADELAFVFAHEAAHHIAGHLDKSREAATVGAIVFGQLAGLSGGGEAAVAEAQRLGAAVGFRTFSKEFELEADALGTRIAAAAGYDPVRGAEFFFRIPDPGNTFLSTHPPNAARVAIVRQTAAGL